MTRVAVVGDVHGHATELMTMLRLLEEHGVDRIILVGDIVDRGDESLACVRLARTWKFEDRDGELASVETVIGNHEINYLYSIQGWKLPGRDFVPKIERSSKVFIWNHLSIGDVDWLGKLPYAIRVDELGITVVHAGVAPWMDRCPTSYDREDAYRLTKIDYLKSCDTQKHIGDFWAKHYDGRFGTVYFGHTTHNKVHYYDHAVAVDMSKGGILSAVVVSDEPNDERHKTFFVTHKDKESIRSFDDPNDPPKPSKKDSRDAYCQRVQRRLFDPGPTQPRFASEPVFDPYADPELEDLEPEEQEPEPSDVRDEIERHFSEAPPKQKRRGKKRKNGYDAWRDASGWGDY